MEVTKFRFRKRGDDEGSLVFLEANIDVPFDVKRVYYIYGTKEGVRRGFHAHKKLEQVLVCVNGSCVIMLDDGKMQTEVLLNDPSEGLFVGTATWREMYDFTQDAVLLVLASEYYDESDYIRNYEEFLRYLKETGV